MLDSSDEAIWGHVREFTEMHTPSAFSQAFYRLMAEYATVTTDTEASRSLLVRFLDREVRYYRQIERFRTKETVTVADLQSLAGKRHIGLCELIDAAKETPSATDKGEIARQLLLAECHYHTEEPEKAVAHLERAVARGADDPLVHFALGYNRYRLAVEGLGSPGEHARLDSSADPMNFQLACLQAVAAFEDALTGQDSDSEVYHWIGRALQTAGFEQAAAQAFDKAEDLAYVEYDDSDPGLGGLHWDDDGPAGLDSEQQRPISEAEVRQVRELLKGPHDISDLWADYGSDPER